MELIKTDFDRIVSYINEKKRVGYSKISQDLGIEWKRIDECCTILKDENQIEIVYPPLGDPVCQVLGYIAPKTKKPIPKAVK